MFLICVHVEIVTEHQKGIVDNVSNCQQLIISTFKEISNAVNNRKDELLLDLNTMKDKKTKELNENCKLIQESINQTNKVNIYKIAFSYNK